MIAYVRSALFAVAVMAGAVASAAPADAGGSASRESARALPDPWPAGEGSDIARRACNDCHDPIVITASRLTAAQWSARVDAMLAKGAKVGDDEIEVLIDYLATHFGPTR